MKIEYTKAEEVLVYLYGSVKEALEVLETNYKVETHAVYGATGGECCSIFDKNDVKLIYSTQSDLDPEKAKVKAMGSMILRKMSNMLNVMTEYNK